LREVIPADEWPEFFSLPLSCRGEVEKWIRSLVLIAKAKPILPEVARAAKEHNVNASSVYRKQKDFERYGWRGLINRAKYPANPPPTSSDVFMRFIHGLWLANDKNYRRTHLQLVALWKQKAPIPGFDRLPEKSSWNDCPDGWTYCNIIYHIKTYSTKQHPKLPAGFLSGSLLPEIGGRG